MDNIRIWSDTTPEITINITDKNSLKQIISDNINRYIYVNYCDLPTYQSSPYAEPVIANTSFLATRTFNIEYRTIPAANGIGNICDDNATIEYWIDRISTEIEKVFSAYEFEVKRAKDNPKRIEVSTKGIRNKRILDIFNFGFEMMYMQKNDIKAVSADDIFVESGEFWNFRNYTVGRFEDEFDCTLRFS